jgi:hypothetical protein
MGTLRISVKALNILAFFHFVNGFSFNWVNRNILDRIKRLNYFGSFLHKFNPLKYRIIYVGTVAEVRLKTRKMLCVNEQSL